MVKAESLMEKRLLANGGEIGQNVILSDLTIRINDGSELINDGDVLTLPTPEEMSSCKFKEIFRNGTSYGIICKRGNEPIKLHKGTFEKIIIVYNPDKTPKKDDGGNIIRVSATGNAVDLYRSCVTVEEAFEKLCKEFKELKFVAHRYPTLNFGRIAVVDTIVYDITGVKRK